MPQQVNCHNCGAVLYQDEELKSAEEIHQMYNGKCPKCGKKLSLIPQNVEVKEATKDTNLHKTNTNVK
jgi:NAD-dependent SIR2 family protein deacetylase